MTENAVTCQGKVINVCEKGNILELHVRPTRGGEIRHVPLPVAINNEFELIPYHMALLGKEVDVKLTEGVGRTRNWKSIVLIIQNGQLAGRKYIYIQYIHTL